LDARARWDRGLLEDHFSHEIILAFKIDDLIELLNKFLEVTR
jgi:hypothetical protein